MSKFLYPLQVYRVASEKIAISLNGSWGEGMAGHLVGSQKVGVLRAWTTTAPGLVVRPGEVVTALVKGSHNGQADLLIKGYHLTAETTLDLAAGSRVRLLVEGQGNSGELLLRVLPGSGPAPGTGQPQTADLLQALGLPSDNLHRTVTEALLRLGFMPQKAGIESLVHTANQLGIKPQSVPGLVWLWSHGLPVSREGSEALARQMPLMPPAPGGPSLASLQGFLAGRVDGQPHPLALWLQDVVDQLQIKPADGTEAATARLASLARNLGLSYEADLTGTLSGQAGKFGSLGEILRQSGIKPLLLALASEPRPSQEGQSLLRVATGLLERVTALQLLSVSGNGLWLWGNGMLSYQEIPFLMQLKQEWQREQDRGEGETAPNEGKPYYRVLIGLTMPVLGPVGARLVLAGQSLSCDIQVERAEAARLLAMHLPRLEQGFAALPWPVRLSYRLEKPGYLRQTIQREMGAPQPAGGIDIRV